MSDQEPLFGFGRGRRPLWTSRDRDAEEIRQLLRAAGFEEFAGRRDGFVVEAGHQDVSQQLDDNDENSDQYGPSTLAVACTGEEEAAAAQAARYAATLRDSGYTVILDPHNACVLRVDPPQR